MRIDPAEFWDVEEACGDDLAVGDDNDGVGIGVAKELFGFCGADFFGLEDGDVGGLSGLFYWGEGDFLAAASGAIGLGDDGFDFEVGLGEEVLQTGDGELWGAAE